MNSLSFIRFILFSATVLAFISTQTGCNHLTYSTVRPSANDTTGNEPDPDFGRSLDFEFQDLTSYLFIGNRVENFSAYFNKYFQAEEDFDLAMEEYRAGSITTYNRRLDSLGVTPPVSASVKEKLDKSIERASKIIQFHKNSKYIDDAVLTIGKAYYFQTDYINAERKFNEFLLRLSSSEFADEALLYLARSKMKMRKDEEAVKILKDIVGKSEDREVKSLASRDLGIYAYNNGNIAEAVEDFKKAIEFSNDNVRKAENQFILARLSSLYKPETSAKEFRKVLDYSPDFDLTFFARLNYAKGLIIEKDFGEAQDELESMRKKYRDYKDFTPLIDLEIANNLYKQGKIDEGKEKYFEVIVKYPNTASSSDAYYFLGKDLEEKHNDYLNALVNYKKSTQENSLSEFYPESDRKSKTLEKYFRLISEIREDSDLRIPDLNPEVEAFRSKYNEEQGIEDLNKQNEIDNRGMENNSGDNRDGDQRGDGKGKPGGMKHVFASQGDSIEDLMKGNDPTGSTNQGSDFNPGKVSEEKSQELKVESEVQQKEQDSISSINAITEQAEKENKIYNSYYELAELFMYDMNMPDSVEFYLNMLLDKYPDPSKKAKTMFMLGNFYKSTGNEERAVATFTAILSEFPNTVYARESRTLLNKDVEIEEQADDDLITRALIKFNSENYDEAVQLLKEFSDKNPADSLSAKALYGIGWIYQNNLYNKDSAVAYYKLLKMRFPESAYYASIAPTLDYFVSLEVNDSDSTAAGTQLSDSLAAIQQGEDGVTGPGKTEVNLREPGARLSVEELEYLLLKGDSR